MALYPNLAAHQNHRACPPLQLDQAMEWLQARRAYAFAIGEELAVQRSISADAYLFLFKTVVRLCKERTYCWPGVDWLAAHLGTSVGTIKRWLDELITAGLIRRSPRPGGQTSVTIIPALEAFDASTAASGNPMTCDQAPAAGLHTGQSERERARHPAQLPPDTQPSAALFFVPGQRITSESCAGSAMIPHTVKRPNPNPSGGMQNRMHPLATTATTQRLIHTGVLDIIADELKDEPLPEIDAIVRYVAQQPHCYNPPGLIVALARAKFGATLLHSARPNHAAGQRRSNGSRGAASAGAPSHPDARHAPVDLASRPGDPRWQRVLDLIKPQVAADEFTTWLSATWLVEVVDGVATIATPNVFARETLEGRFLPLITAALHTVLGSAVQPQIVIGA